MERVFLRSLIASFAIMSLLGMSRPLFAQSQGGSRQPLIELGLTTSREKGKTAEGAFSASVLAKSGLVPALYNCQKNVEATVGAWADKNGLKLIEKKSGLAELRLAYSSKSPPGNFLLDYSVSPNAQAVTEASITLSFRSLSNVRLSGDDVGLEPLGQRLLQAIQCVPRRY